MYVNNSTTEGLLLDFIHWMTHKKEGKDSWAFVLCLLNSLTGCRSWLHLIRIERNPIFAFFLAFPRYRQSKRTRTGTYDITQISSSGSVVLNEKGLRQLGTEKAWGTGNQGEGKRECEKYRRYHK